MSLDISSVVIAGLGALSAYLSIKLQSTSQQKLRLQESLNKQKQKVYQDLVEFLFDVIESDHKYSEEEKIQKATQLLRKMTYSSSPDVLKSFGDFMQAQYNDSDPDHIIARKLMAELIVQIRKDLGLRSRFSRENWLDVMRIYIRDIHEFLPKRHQGHRGKKTYPRLTYKGRAIK